jgi:hypothetical protein
MFTENEIDALIKNEEILSATQKLKAAFIEEDAPYLDISDHDFLSLVMLTPSICIANANNSISLMEEMALNKKARKYSKGGYFMKLDPVVSAMGIFIKVYDQWEDKFLAHLKYIGDLMLNKDDLRKSNIDASSTTDEEYCFELLKAPFVLVRMLGSYLSNAENDDLSVERKVLKVEYDSIVELLTKLDLIDLPLVQKHLSKFVIR